MPIVTQYSQLDRKSLPDKIAECLRRAYVTGALSPGERLIEQDLSRRLGVSRGALREALRMLQQEGLVETRHNRGTYVTRLDEQDIEEIYSLRSLLEAFAASRAAHNAPAESLEQLQILVEDMKAAAERGDYRRMAELDISLHRTIWEIAGHQRLLQILSSLEPQIHMLLIMNMQEFHHRLADSVINHQRIIDAICQGQPDDAAQFMKQHIETAAERMRGYRRKGGLSDNERLI